jgi:hypothetical protein
VYERARVGRRDAGIRPRGEFTARLARKRRDSPRSTTVVRNTRSPRTIGGGQPRPGISAFHSTFSVADHPSGGFVCIETPRASAPRLRSARKRARHKESGGRCSHQRALKCGFHRQSNRQKCGAYAVISTCSRCAVNSRQHAGVAGNHMPPGLFVPLTARSFPAPAALRSRRWTIVSVTAAARMQMTAPMHHASEDERPDAHHAAAHPVGHAGLERGV